MTDERLLRTFSQLDAPVMPNAAFADRLFEDLATELGLRRQARSGDRVASRARAALRLDHLPVGAPTVRLFYLAAAVGLLLALLGGTLYVASRLQARPAIPELAANPILELVDRSRAVYVDPPAVRFTIRDWMGESRVASDGRGTWRSETPDDVEGSYSLYDGARTGYYDATTRTFTTSPVTKGGPPYPFNDEFTWTSMSFPGLVATMTPIPCPEPVDLGTATVAGRTARHVDCPEVEYWIDEQTALVLRMAVDPSSTLWNGTFASPATPEVTEVTAFELLDTVDEAAFAWAAPPDDAPRTGTIAGTNLVIGERPPTWSGHTIDGLPISTDAIRGPAALLFFSTSFGTAAYDIFSTEAPKHPGVRPLIVGVTELGTLVGFTGAHPTTLDVIADPDATAMTTPWGINELATIVLLDEDGAVSGLVPGSLTAADLDRVLSAAEKGMPIPAVQRAPVVSPDPAPDRITEPCGDDEMTCLKPGSILPAWAGTRLEGGTLSGSDLLGKPAVLYTPGPVGMCDGPCPSWVFDDLRSFAALAARYDGVATFLLVPWGERMPGDVQAQLAEAGVDVEVVFDWDGSIQTALDLATGGLLVVDGEGRLAGQAQAGALDTAAQATVTATLDRILGRAGASVPPSVAP